MTQVAHRSPPRCPPLGWLLAFTGFAVAYMLLRDAVPQQWGWIIKIAPIVLLLQLALTQSSGRVRSLLAVALILSATGDTLLSLEGLFIPGLAAFLLAQLTYTGLFLTQWHWRASRLPWAALILAYTLGCAMLVIPRTGELQVVTTAYMVAISLMALSAVFRADRQFLWVASGALVFMISDTLIAVDKFVTPFVYADTAIMATYYAAQALIVVGLVNHARSPSN